jgi:hypothetical protein
MKYMFLTLSALTLAPTSQAMLARAHRTHRSPLSGPHRSHRPIPICKTYSANPAPQHSYEKNAHIYRNEMQRSRALTVAALSVTGLCKLSFDQMLVASHHYIPLVAGLSDGPPMPIILTAVGTVAGIAGIVNGLNWFDHWKQQRKYNKLWLEECKRNSALTKLDEEGKAQVLSLAKKHLQNALPKDKNQQ